MSAAAEQPGRPGPQPAAGEEAGRAVLVRLREGAASAPSAEAAVHLLGLVAREMTALLGRYDRETLVAWRELGRQNCLAGETSAAVHLLGQVLTDMAQVLGPTDLDTLHAHLELATALGEDGDPRTAAQRLGDLLPVLAATAGPTDPRTLATHCRHAVNTGRTGEVAIAFEQLRALVPQLQRQLPADTALLAEARTELARLVSAWRRTPGAAPGPDATVATALVHRLLVWDFDSDAEADTCLADLAWLSGRRNLADRLARMPDDLAPEEATAVLLG